MRMAWNFGLNLLQIDLFSERNGDRIDQISNIIIFQYMRIRGAEHEKIGYFMQFYH